MSSDDGLTPSERRLLDYVVGAGSNDPDTFDAHKSIDRTTEELLEGEDIEVETTVDPGEEMIVRYHTEDDDHVCLVCAHFEGEEYDIGDEHRPQLPIHPNCRCWYEHVVTGEILAE
jgi:hypothetical protein